MASPYLGYALLGAGIVIILLALIMGYGVYVSASGNLGNLQLATGGSSTINESISAFTGSVGATAAMGTYAAIEVAILFLFASIGYKVAFLGIQMNRPNGTSMQKQARIKDNS